MTKDFFAQKAGEYDKGSRRVANVMAIVQSIVKNIVLNKDMHLLDFGAGTGLLLAGIAPYVHKVTAVDISASMIAELEKKQAELPCELNILQADLLNNEGEARPQLDAFDGIVSSMTLHHIADIAAVLALFKSLLKPGGFIALADLDTEDGSFHTEDTGVFHHGFDRGYMLEMAKNAGFNEVQISTANECEKNDKTYSVFLMVGRG